MHYDHFKQKSYLKLIKKYVFSEGEQFPLTQGSQSARKTSRDRKYSKLIGCSAACVHFFNRKNKENIPNYRIERFQLRIAELYMLLDVDPNAKATNSKRKYRRLAAKKKKQSKYLLVSFKPHDSHCQIQSSKKKTSIVLLFVFVS